MPFDVDKVARDQNADHARFISSLERAQERIDELDRELPREVRDERTRAIRDETLTALKDIRAALLDRANKARREQRGYTREAILRRARFDSDPVKNAQISAAWSARLAIASPVDLIEHMRDAAQSNNLALAELVRLQFNNRGGQELKKEFDREFARIDVPVAPEVDAIQKVTGHSIMAEQKLREFLSGRSDPAGRIAAARAAGLVQQVKLSPDDPARDGKLAGNDPAARMTASRQQQKGKSQAA